MKIALLGYGNSAHIQRLASGLAALGHIVTVISAAKYAPFPEASGVSYVTYDSDTSALIKIIRIRKILKDSGAEILHSHFVNHGGVLGVATGFHPHVISAWGCDVLNVPGESILKKVAVIGALRAADGLLPVSTQLRDEITRLTGGIAFNVVSHWGVNTDHFTPNPKAAAEFRQKHGISLEDRVALSPRGIEELYQQHQLFAAWPEVKARIPNARLVVLRSIINDREYLGALEKQAAELGFAGEIVWIDKVSFDEMPAMYGAADAVVSIARSDGTPMTVLEAMSCGCPMVSSDLPSLREWVQDGVNGVRVHQKDAAAVAEGIIKMLMLGKKESAAISLANREKIRAEADHRGCIKKIEAIYERFVDRSTRPTEAKNWAKTVKNLVGLR